MARISGVDLPPNKRSFIGLTYIHGIGRSVAMNILEKAKVDQMTKIKDLSDDEVARIRKIIQDEYIVEGDLRRKVSMDIKRLQDIVSYRGMRHRYGLPSRGQRSKTNARTRKGRKRIPVAGKKK